MLGTSLKLYYLSQTAFWVQQIFVINIEERRKDHWQMFAHHIVTVFLLFFSYGYRQMRAGNAVLVLMDSVDLIFPVRCLGLPFLSRFSTDMENLACEDPALHWLPDSLRHCLWLVCRTLACRKTFRIPVNLLEYLCACVHHDYGLRYLQHTRLDTP